MVKLKLDENHYQTINAAGDGFYLAQVVEGCMLASMAKLQKFSRNVCSPEMSVVHKCL